MRRELLTDEHEQFRESFSRWLAAEVVPHHGEWEADGIVPRRRVRRRRRARLPRHGRPRGVRRRWRRRLPLQPRDHRGGAGGRRVGLGPRSHAAQRHLPAVLPALLHRRATSALAAGHRVGRAHHGDRHDRAGHRVGPRVDVDDGDPRRRPLRRERLEDLHHQRHQRRPRHHRGQDRSDAAAQGDEPARARAGHGRVRTGSQPRQDRHARAGHRRAVLRRRAGAGGQPARAPRAQGFAQLVANLPAGAAVDRRGRRGRGPGRARLDARLRQGAHGLRPADRHRSRTPASCWPRWPPRSRWPRASSTAA